jgi:hypothetical protein
MKVMLLFPPPWTPAMPHLALPTLASYLRPRGVEVTLRDLNLEVFEHILSRHYVEQSVERLCAGSALYAARQPCRRPAAGPEAVQWALARGPQLAAQVETALGTIRSDAFLDGPGGLQAFLVIAQCLELASLPFHPASLALSGYIPPAPPDSSRRLLRAARDAQSNIFLDIFRPGILRDIERERPQIVGISIPTLEQMPAATTLAYLIKEAGLPCHVTVGGPHISMLRGELPRVPGLFDLIDSAIIFEGEQPLLRLAEALDGNRNLYQVPGLIFRDGGQVRATPPARPDESAPLSLPDFDGLPLDRYLAPHLVLPLVTSRGCYHGKCAFCNVGYGRPASYRPLAAEGIAEQMMALHHRHGTRHIFFADEVIAPRNLKGMSSLLEELGSPLHWCACVRFERALTEELLQAMARAGCRMLLFGLETASEPIMQRMAKGTRIEEMGRILQQSAEAGIWNHVFFFFGFPGETIDHAQETVNFVYAHQEAIHSGSPGAFLLERFAPAHQAPQQYGIKRVIQNPEKDLAIYFDYEPESGMDEEMAEHLASRLVDVLPEKPFAHFYAHDAYRFLYASQLREQGMPLPPWLVPAGEHPYGGEVLQEKP